MSWLVERLEVVEGGVLATGIFGGDRQSLRFHVEEGPGGVVVVARPPQLRMTQIVPGGREQAVLEVIRRFYEVSRVAE